MTEIEPGLDEAYGAIRDWESNGNIPVAGKERIIADTVTKLRRYENLRKRVSKIRGWINRGKLVDDEQKKYEAELSLKVEEMDVIKQELSL